MIVLMKIFVVIPGHNEEQYVATVLKKVQKVTKNIIFVDDGSSDTSAKIAKRYTDHVLVHETNLGKGAALTTGCEYAFGELDADAVIFMDSDDQHDPREIPKFVTALQDGAELVFGVRREGPYMPALRFIGNKFASVILNVLFQMYIPDIPSGYKAMTHKAYKKVRWNSSGYEVEAEIAARTAKQKLPFAVVEIDPIYHDTDKGMTVLDAIHIGIRLLQWKLEL